jgi:predicted CXXCH cytochrome family protein
MGICGSAVHESGHYLELVGADAGTQGRQARACLVCHGCGLKAAIPNRSSWGTSGQAPAGWCDQQRTDSNLSLMCLSCHDGAIAPPPPTSEEWFGGRRTIGDPVSVPLDRRTIGHHPFHVAYPVDGNRGFLPARQVTACSVSLFGVSQSHGYALTVECPSCHDVHRSSENSYLRVSMDRYELCLCCHRRVPPLSRAVYLPMQKDRAAIEGGDCIEIIGKM